MICTILSLLVTCSCRRHNNILCREAVMNYDSLGVHLLPRDAYDDKSYAQGL